MVRFTVFAAVGEDFRFQSGVNMKGKAIDKDGNVVRRWDPDNRPGDIFTVKEILQVRGRCGVQRVFLLRDAFLIELPKSGRK